MLKYHKLIFSILTSIYFTYTIFTFPEWHFLDNVNLIFHEAGHPIIFFLGDFMQALAGSIFQVAVPFIIAVYFFLHRNFVSSSIVLMWMGQSILNVSVYVKDARDMALPLLGGDNVKHDWNYILAEFGRLEHTEKVFSITFAIGVIVILFGVLGSLYFSYRESQDDPLIRAV